MYILEHRVWRVVFWLCLSQSTAWWRRCGAAGWSGCPKPGRETCQTNSTSALRGGESETGDQRSWVFSSMAHICQNVSQHRHKKKCDLTIWGDAEGTESDGSDVTSELNHLWILSGPVSRLSPHKSFLQRQNSSSRLHRRRHTERLFSFPAPEIFSSPVLLN